MNAKLHSLFALLLMAAVATQGITQDNAPTTLDYGIYRVYPSISLEKEELLQASTLSDLYAHYKPDWIREYIAVMVTAIKDGRSMVAIGKSEALTDAQKDLMYASDTGSEIAVTVRYMPENELLVNEAKQIKFTFTIEPESGASFPGGDSALSEYLSASGLSAIPDDVITNYAMAAVRFTIDELGSVTDAHVFWSSEDDGVDDILVETVCNMPAWQPASYHNGLKVSQEFALMVGSMESCAVNLLNIRREQ